MQKPTVEVLRGASRAKLPEPGSIVIARITKINPRLASARLLCINTLPLAGTFTGIIRYSSSKSLLADEAKHSMRDRRSPSVLERHPAINDKCNVLCRQQDVRATEIDKVTPV